jgi:Arc/MetJ family transcription regulator
MPTNLGIDDTLLDEAYKIGGFSSKKATVNEALKEFIQRRKQRRIVELFGKIDYYPDYNPKDGRRKR